MPTRKRRLRIALSAQIQNFSLVSDTAHALPLPFVIGCSEELKLNRILDFVPIFCKSYEWSRCVVIKGSLNSDHVAQWQHAP